MDTGKAPMLQKIMTNTKSICSSLCLLSLMGFPSVGAFGQTTFQLNPVALPSAEAWLETEVQVAKARINLAISQPDTERGVVIASPSRTSPNYYYHWVRDGALTMDVVASLLASGDTSGPWQQKLLDYAKFSRQNQMANSITGLGEPKFQVDGTPFAGPWGRPQNDGPALRALTFLHFAQILLQNGQAQYVRTTLYDGASPSQSLIKADLDYVAAHWADPSFDLWEEVKGTHFFTRMVQRKALLAGASLAQSLGYQGDSDWYLRQAQAIAADLPNFWNASAGYIGATRNYVAGLGSKASNLDIAVVLGVIHGSVDDGVFDFDDQRVRLSVNALIEKFGSLYSINHVSAFPAEATGRYPEDVYDGANFQGGNPWVLSTLAIAEAFYATAEAAKSDPGLGVDPATLLAQGDLYVQRVALHANPDGTLSEQIDRNSGYMVSANNLTWNYSSVLRTYWARQRAQ